MESLELMKIKGIPLRIHPSWFLILLLFTWTAQGQLSNVSDASLPAWMRWGVGLITALLLFVSVLLHELGHSFVALNDLGKPEPVPELIPESNEEKLHFEQAAERRLQRLKQAGRK